VKKRKIQGTIQMHPRSERTHRASVNGDVQRL